VTVEQKYGAAKKVAEPYESFAVYRSGSGSDLSALKSSHVTDDLFITRLFLIRYENDEITLADSGRFVIEVPVDEAESDIVVTIRL
jgi:hypothetical protein